MKSANFDINIGKKEAKRALRKGEKNLDKVMAKTLTQSAAALRPDGKKQAQKVFNIQNPWILKGFRYKKATTKRQVATFYHRDSFLRKQEVGARRLTKNSRITIPVPGRNIEKRGRVPMNKRAKSLLKKEEVARSKEKKAGNRNNRRWRYYLTSPGRKYGKVATKYARIVRFRGNGSTTGAVQTVYHLHESVRIKKRFRLKKVVKRNAPQYFKQNFRVNWDKYN